MVKVNFSGMNFGFLLKFAFNVKAQKQNSRSNEPLFMIIFLEAIFNTLHRFCVSKVPRDIVSGTMSEQLGTTFRNVIFFQERGSNFMYSTSAEKTRNDNRRDVSRVSVAPQEGLAICISEDATVARTVVHPRRWFNKSAD